MPNPNPRCGDGAQSSVACPDSWAFSSNFSQVAIRLAAREPACEPTLPVERMADNRGKIVKARPPSENIAYALACSDDASRIALPPRRLFDQEIASGHALDRVNHLANRKSVTIAAVERERLPPGAQIAQCQAVCGAEIGDVNVVADAGTVRRRIVGAEYFELRTQSERGFRCDFDQVCCCRARLSG